MPRLETQNVALRPAGLGPLRRLGALPSFLCRRLLSTVKPDHYVVALDERGRTRTSIELSQWLGKRLQEGRDLCFLVGGADGFAPPVLQRADERWSLSALTLPHALVRVVFAEQIYRAVTLLDGHPYHRE